METETASAGPSGGASSQIRHDDEAATRIKTAEEKAAWLKKAKEEAAADRKRQFILNQAVFDIVEAEIKRRRDDDKTAEEKSADLKAEHQAVFDRLDPDQVQAVTDLLLDELGKAQEIELGGSKKPAPKEKMKFFFFYDANFTPLRDHMVDTLVESGNDFELKEDFLEDLGVMKNRAGGGIPTYLYKAQKIREALASVSENEVFVFSDVDVQFFGRIVQTMTDVMEHGADLVLQREFEDIGVNIGFMAMRNTEATRGFWEHVYTEIKRLQGLDQRIVNNLLYSGQAASLFGLRWDRFPLEIWASSMAYSGRVPEGILVHHVNFTVEKPTASNPCVKLAQMRELRKGGEEQAAFAAITQADTTMNDYRDRHFGARRPGPEWVVLPEGHIARPGGFKEKKKKKGAAIGATQEGGVEGQAAVQGA